MSVEEFIQTEPKSAMYVQHLVNRPEDQSHCLKSAICAVAEVYYGDSQRTIGIASENTDGYSASYDTTPLSKQLFDAAYRYLSGTGLLYCGV